jgi:hypothetical protein
VDDFNTKLHLAIWGAAFGATASLIVNYVFASLAPRITRCNLTRHLKVHAQPNLARIALCRVHYGGYWTIGQAIAYLRLEFANEDVLQPPEGQNAFIKPGRIARDYGQLCWSVRAPTENPIKVDIFAKESQHLGLCEIQQQHIMVPSEEGWEDSEGKHPHARVFLVRKKYCGVLKIVSADTNAKCFRVEIDPERIDQAVIICRMRCPRQE